MVVADRWGEAQALHYPGMSVDLSTGTVLLEYELKGSKSSVRFVETITFPVPAQLPDAECLAALRRVLELLYVAGGTSYFKLTAPRRVVLDSVPLADKALPWATALFREGLAEYAYRNNLPHVLELSIEAQTVPGVQPFVDLYGPGRAPLVAVGGGKDSIVSIDAIKRAGMDPVLFAVKPNQLIRAVMEAAGGPVLSVQRTLDARLFALNAEGGAYNGHVPVTAINSLIGVAAALLHGHGPVVMSNERSASAPNLTWRGHGVNHQWSKGIEAEALLRQALAVHGGVTTAYFSLLRGLSELHIARLFAEIKGYDDVVSSCNGGFRIGDVNPRRWCANCDKCRFVYLALAPFMPRHRLVSIFEADLLEDLTQLAGYRELCGLASHKPFECVGETDECLVALRLLTEHADWSSSAVVRQLAAEVAPSDWPSAATTARVFTGDAANFVPAPFAEVLGV